MKNLLLFALGVCCCCGPASGQNLVPNPSFEAGTSSPTSWGVQGAGTWENFGLTGAREVSLNGAPSTLPYWYSFSVPVQQGKAYVARFWCSSSNMTQGYCFGGFNTVSRDFNRPGNIWSDYSYVAWIPSNGTPTFRIGTWDANGKIYVDDAEVLPLDPVHKLVGSYRLGDGESLNAGHYEFRSRYDAYSGNYSRPLQGGNYLFNTYRWYFDSPASSGKNVNVLYRHDLGPGQTFTNALITCGIQNYNSITSTSLWVEVSTNGQNWQFAGGMKGTNVATFSVPATLLPAPELFVRLGTVASQQFALSNYVFTADVPDVATSAVGETHYWGQWLAPTNVQITEVNNTPSGKQATLLIGNPAPTNQTFEIKARAEFDGNVRERIVTMVVPAGTTNSTSILLATAGFGDNIAVLQVRDGAGILRLHESMRYTVSILADDSYGETLPTSVECPAWWCAGPYKVGRTRALPLAANTTMRVSAARNEYEPFQLVLRPTVALSNVTVTLGDFTGLTNAAIISATNVTICRAEYVPVTMVFSSELYSASGDHVDPLVPLTAPFTTGAGTNYPLWFTVFVPKDAPAGEYEAQVTVGYDGGSFSIPVRLRVFDFALTDVTHTRTAYGVIPQEPWHGLSYGPSPQAEQVWELYMQNMARHRISPFFPQWYNILQWTFNSGNQTFTYNYTQFDSVMERFLEEYNFTSFKDINYERELPPIGGYARFNASSNAINATYRPLYTKLMQPVAQHLRERGWIDRVYSFWLDEPQGPQYPLVRDGMMMIEETAPDLSRFQSEFNGPTPMVNATIWLPQLTGLNVDESARRQAAGDEMWFYLATGPKAPWPNNFIDHPAINPRIRSWFGEKFNLDGEAYYGINYYLGTTNPWTSPMSFSSYPNLGIYYWGNGDGTLVYPPVKEKPVTPVIAGPIDSLRWEMTRDGMEDREYFWLLERALTNAESQLGTNHPAVLEGRAAKAEAMGMIPWPPAYPYEPERLLASRQRIAEAIEALDDGSPFIAKEPLSKVVLPGGAERLRVEAVGWPLPSIQWQHEGTNVPGGLGAKLSLTNITTDMAGAYRVIASNTSGSVTSAVGRLTVLITNLPPVVIKDPDSLTRTNGERAVFGVGASSLTPVSYQWLRNGTPIAGATNVTLALSNVSIFISGSYSVQVSNATGVATSAPALLTVQGVLAPSITSQPTNVDVSLGQNAQFAVTAVGTDPLGYQWYFNTNTLLSGSTSNLLSLTNIQSSQLGGYRVIVTNLAGAVTSSPALLQLYAMPNYTNEPPGVAGSLQGSDFVMTLAPDNRTRTVLVSTNLIDWDSFYTAVPSASPVLVPTPFTNEPHRFFRVLVGP